MKILKYALLAIGGLAILAGAVAAYVAATFDPNQYKPQIIQAVKEKTQRNLRLEGNIALTFWPSIGASLGKASLSERGGDREFAAVDEARVSLKLMPLLSRQAVVDKVYVKGLRAHIVKGKDGKTNADDIAAQEPKPGPTQPAQDFKVDIAGVEITDATIQYTDQAAGAKYVLSKLDLKTGRIAPGVPTTVEFSARAQGEKPKLDLQTKLKTRVAFDPGELVSLADLDLEAKGAAAGLTGITLKATGGLAARPRAGEFTASKLAAALTATSGKDNLDVRLDAPRLLFTADKASGDKLTIVAKIGGPGGTTNANLSLPGVEGTAQAFKVSAMTLDLDMKQGELAVKGRIASPVSGNIKAQQVSLPQLKASLTASGPDIPGKNLAAELAGSANADFAKESVLANLAGKVGDSNVKGQVGVADFSPLRYTFNLDIDQLDVDRYTGQPSGGQPAPGQKPAAAQKQPEKPFDLSALKNLNAAGSLHVGNLKASNVKASNVKLELKAANGRVDVSPLTANLYQGTLSSAISVNAAPATPTFAVKHSMSGVNVGPLLRDLANNDTLEGRGNVTVDVTTQGNTVSAMKKGLNGNAAVKLADGSVKGIDVAGSIRNAKAKLGALRGEQTQQADKTQKTDFSALTATFVIKNGVASNKDLDVKSPLLRVDGAGDINIGEDSLNYLVKASIVGTTKGQGGRETEDLKGITVPVRVSGPLAAPSYKLDFGSMLTDTAKQKAKEAIGSELQRRFGGGDAAKGGAGKAGPAKKDAPASGSGSRDRLKGLFGR